MARFRDEWKRAVNEVLARHGVDDTPLSPRTAERLASRYGTLSHATINEWKTKGKVPADDNKIRFFADGLKEYRVPLFRAAGIEPDPDGKDDASDEALRKERGDFPADPAGANEGRQGVSRNDLKQSGDREEGGKENSMPTLEQSLVRMGTFVNADDERVLSTVPGGYRGAREETDGVFLNRLVPYDYILQVEGDSMAPIYPEGTVVFVRKNPFGEPVLRRPNIVLIDGSDPTCAYVEEGEEWATYVLYKENGDYQEETFDAKRLTFQGEVVFHVAASEERPRRKATEG